MDNLHYLFAAFAAIWIVFFAYLIRLNRRTEELKRQVQELERWTKDKESDLPAKSESDAG